MSDSSERCSFCGKARDEHAELFRPEDESAASGVAICEDCVLTCAKAIDVEQRLTERPPSKPRGDAVPDSERPVQQAGWNAFRVGKLNLEWRAERGVVVSVRRSDNHERVVFERFGAETEPNVDDAETVAEDHWATLHR